MAITVLCDCGAKFQVRDEYAGKKGQCPTCGAIVRIAADGDEPQLSLDDDVPPAREDTYEFDDPPRIEEPPRPRRRRHAGDAWFSFGRGSFLGLTRKSSSLLMMFGLTLVIFSRGCESTAARSAASLSASLQLAKNQFEDRWAARAKAHTDEIKRIREQQAELRRNGQNDKALELEKQIDDLQKKLNDMADEKGKERRRLEESDWKNYELAQRDARHKTIKWRWWLAWMFLIGTLVLAFGLIGLAVTGESTERTIAFIMISILAFSIYVGGIAWLDSIRGAVDPRF